MRNLLQRGLLLAWVSMALPLFAENLFTWNTNRNVVTADLKAVGLSEVLEHVAKLTGWQVYLEPGISHETSTKFKNLPPGEALRLLLGSLNFALLPEKDASSRLYVFETSRGNATQRIRPKPARTGSSDSKLIGNELIVRLKPGVKIEDLARLLGAKIKGRLDALNIYRLEFTDEAAAQAARDSLLNNPDVTGVDSNYSVDRPSPPESLPSSLQPQWNLEPKDSSGHCQATVGLIDTSVGALGNGLDSFLLPSLSVADTAGSASSELTHGTAMAQAILQSIQTNISGNKTAVKILPVDVYGSSSTTTTFELGQGIYAAVNAGATIINLSLGGSGDSTFLHGLIVSASKQGVVFLGAAGNEPVTTPTYPAAYPEVIAVTASDPSGRIAGYANHGNFVSIMAPGTSIASFQGQTYLVTGTSSATALATGYVAGLADSTHDCPNQVTSTLRSKWGVKFNSQP